MTSIYHHLNCISLFFYLTQLSPPDRVAMDARGLIARHETVDFNRHDNTLMACQVSWQPGEVTLAALTPPL